jgi:hypothetical protein
MAVLGVLRPMLLLGKVAEEEVIMSKSNPIYLELVYVLMAVVVAVAVRVNLPPSSISKPELVAAPCTCIEI